MRSARWLAALYSLHVLFACSSSSTGRGAAGTGGAGGKSGSGGTDDREGGSSEAGGAPDPDAASAGAPALASLGGACRLHTDCTSGHCADGVCCDARCDGLCTQCSRAGRCQAATDDPACPVIDCVVGTNPCASYEARIVTNRCKAVNQCKTQTDCKVSALPARTECTLASSPLSLCNAASTCVHPSVSCNARSCAIGTNTCCHEFTRESQALTSLCVAAAECPATSFNTTLEVTRTPISCDQHEDCRLGQLCSLQLSFTSSRIHCVPAAQANQQGGFTPSSEVCQSPAASAPCSAGSCQRTYPQFPGWRFCAP